MTEIHGSKNIPPGRPTKPQIVKTHPDPPEGQRPQIMDGRSKTEPVPVETVLHAPTMIEGENSIRQPASVEGDTEIRLREQAPKSWKRVKEGKDDEIGNDTD